MTATTHTVSGWATHPAGKAARAFIAVTGMITAILVMMTAALVSTGSWALVMIGVGLAASSIRAARLPTTGRLAVVATTLISIPLTIQIF